MEFEHACLPLVLPVEECCASLPFVKTKRIFHYFSTLIMTSFSKIHPFSFALLPFIKLKQFSTTSPLLSRHFFIKFTFSQDSSYIPPLFPPTILSPQCDSPRSVTWNYNFVQFLPSVKLKKDGDTITYTDLFLSNFASDVTLHQRGSR